MKTGITSGSKRLLLPAGLDLRALLPANNYKDIPKYQLLLHKIYERRCFNKKFKEVENQDSSFVQLKSTYLQHLFTTKKAKTIVTNLQAWGVIEVDHFFLRGVKSKGYRLTPEYQDQPGVWTLMEDPLLERKLAKLREGQRAAQLVAFPESQELLAWMFANLHKLRIKHTAALDYITTRLGSTPPQIGSSPYKEKAFVSPTSSAFLYGYGATTPQIGEAVLTSSSSKGRKWVYSSSSKASCPTWQGEREVEGVHEGGGSGVPSYVITFPPEEEGGYQQKHFESDRLSIEYLHRRAVGELFMLRDTVGERVHSNLTNLRGGLRRFLYLPSGERLVNLDIKTSQPTLFNALIVEHFGQDLPEDALLYMSLTCDPDKDLYRYVMGKLGLHITKKSRNAFKKVFFGKVFYCELNEAYQYNETKIFRKLFPNVYEVIKHHKKKDYRQLPIDMQKRESKLIIDTVCMGLFKDYGKDFFCATIHDSILTTEANAELVKSRMQEGFQSMYGFTPHITIELIN